MGISFEREYLYTLKFADDQVVREQDKFGLEHMTKKLVEEYSKWSLEDNIGKTKYLSIIAKPENLVFTCQMEISACTEYKYLGIWFDLSCTDDAEIRSKIIQAKHTIVTLNGIFMTGPAQRAIFREFSRGPARFGAPHVAQSIN